MELYNEKKYNLDNIKAIVKIEDEQFTSSNDILKRFINKYDKEIKKK